MAGMGPIPILSTTVLSDTRLVCVSVALILVNKKFFKLWNKEYRDGINTRGDKIGMSLCINQKQP